MHRVISKSSVFLIGLLLVTGMFIGQAAAQMVDGIYYGSDQAGGKFTLNLRQNPNGTISGNIIAKGGRFEITARIEKDVIIGQMFGANGRMAFEAEIEGKQLEVAIYGINANGRINYQDSTDLTFSRQGPRLKNQTVIERNVAQPGTLTNSAAVIGALSGKLNSRPKRRSDLAANNLGGTYKNDEITVRLIGSGALYQGDAVYRGKTYQLQVNKRNGVYFGHYSDNGKRYPVQVSVTDGVMTLATADNQFKLNKVATAAFGQSGSHRTNLDGRNPGNLNSKGLGYSKRPGHFNLGQQQQNMALDDGTAKGREWSHWLAGKKVTQISSYSSGSAGGYNTRNDVHLCRNGQFAMAGNSAVSVDTGGASGNSGGNHSGQGRWKIVTKGARIGIRLEYGNGQLEMYELQYNGGKTYANGDRVYVTNSGRCQ